MWPTVELRNRWHTRIQCNLPIRVPFIKDKDILTQRFISTGGVIIITLS